MKRIILSAIALLAVAAIAGAQGQYRYISVAGWDGTTTNSVIGAKAESLIDGTYTNGIAFTKNEQATVFVAYKPLNAESNVVTLHWQKTADPLYWPVCLGTTNPTIAGCWVVGTGHLTNTAGWSVWFTNLPMDSTAYWRASAISNTMAAASYITNVTVRVYFKPGS